jgi:hypothetical protein
MKKISFVSLILLANALGGCSESMPVGDPAKRLNSEMRGWEAPIGVMMGLNETPYWVQSAVAGFRPATSDDQPAKIIELKTSGGCTFVSPGPNEVLAKVQVDNSKMESSIHAVSREKLAKHVKDYISKYKAGNDEIYIHRNDDRVGIVDVIVTEKSKPVYLVIAYTSPTIFNIQLANGARLSRVALVGGGAVGVANIDPSIPIGALSGRAIQSCNVLPVRRPADHWQFVRNVKNNPGIKDVLNKNYSMFSSFSGWYRQNFGAPSEPDDIGAMTTSHVLVGPLPETLEMRVEFKSLEGATVALSKVDHLFVGTDAEYKQKLSEQIAAAATKIAGGDLTKLKPAQ